MLTHGDEMPVAVHAVSPNPLAWATGKFIYRNTPIDEVLKELSLYYGTLLYTFDSTMESNFCPKLMLFSDKTSSLTDFVRNSYIISDNLM